MVFLVIDLAWLEKGEYASYTVIILSFLHIILSCMVLSEMAMDETREVRLMSEPYFWFAAGVVVFSVGNVIMLGFHQYIRDHNLVMFGKPLYRVIMPMLNVILYSCYTYAFYLCTKYPHKWQASSLPS